MNENLKKWLDVATHETYDMAVIQNRLLNDNDLIYTYPNLDIATKSRLIYLAFTCESEEIIKKMLAINDDVIIYALIENPKIPEDILEKIMYRKETEKVGIETIISQVDYKLKVMKRIKLMNNN